MVYTWLSANKYKKTKCTSLAKAGIPSLETTNLTEQVEPTRAKKKTKNKKHHVHVRQTTITEQVISKLETKKLNKTLSLNNRYIQNQKI